MRTVSWLMPLVLSSGLAYAQSYSVIGPAYITFVENGWFGEGVAVRIDPNTTLQGCGPDFGVRAEHPAYKQLTALIVSAYHAKSKVELVVNPGDCVFGNRTNITSVRLIQ
jgi:hypothetical protein